MFKKIKKNPIYELQKRLLREKIIMGILDEEHKLETDDKLMYTIMERVYKAGESVTHHNILKIKVMFGALGFIVGIFLTMFFTFILKLK